MPDRFVSRLSGIMRDLRSVNHGSRIGFDAPDCLVLHYTGMVDGPSAIAWLRNPASQVSCHYVVTEAGAVLQLVDEDRRAWHAGRSSWCGIPDMNSASIGIEIVNGGHDFGLPPFPDLQIAAVIRLCRDIMERHAILPVRVLAHSDIAPGRKRDPGERFPWARLAAEGVGVWPALVSSAAKAGPHARGSSGDEVRRLQASLAEVGYSIGADGTFGPETETVVQAFQRHFRPERVDGIADAATIDRLNGLRARA